MILNPRIEDLAINHKKAKSPNKTIFLGLPLKIQEAFQKKMFQSKLGLRTTQPWLLDPRARGARYIWGLNKVSLSDPGIPGPIYGFKCLWVTELETLLKLNWCDSGWWRCQINTRSVKNVFIKRVLQNVVMENTAPCPQHSLRAHIMHT